MRIYTTVAAMTVLLALIAERSGAATSTLFLTGDSAAGVPGGLYESFQAGTINGAGTIAFHAQLQLAAGGVTSSDSNGIWLLDSDSHSLVARTGSGGVPEVTGADFELFRDLAIDSTGNVYLRSSLAVGAGGVTSSNREGIWRFTSGIEEEIVRTGTTVAPDVPTTTFSALSNNLRVAGSGPLTLLGTLNFAAGVDNHSDKGIWNYDSLDGNLVARERTGVAPGITGLFEIFSPELFINNNQQIAFRAVLLISGAINSSNQIGIWRCTTSGGELIAREGVGNVPGLSVTSFTGLEDPVFNGSGQIAITSSLTHYGSVNSTNDAGLWLYTGTSGSLLAQRGSAGVPGVPGASFEAFGRPILSDSGLVLTQGELQIGVGGVTASDNLGLWTFDGATSHLVARSGSGGVPGIPGASYSDFSDMSMNSSGEIVVKAMLQAGGAIDSTNDGGLWFFDSQGDGTLVAREGDLLAGRTIESLSFLAGSGGNDGIPTGFNSQGQLLFQADFTNGDSGLFLFQNLEADFDNDGDVDRTDLTHPVLGWEARYGIDLTGEDFLNWQREFDAVAPLVSSLAAVPEPATVRLSCIFSLLLACRRRII